MTDPLSGLYVPPIERPGTEDGEVVTLVVHRLGVIDVRWNVEIGRWTWLRVLRSFLG